MLLKRILFLSVFFRGFRGHNIRHYQIETVLPPNRKRFVEKPFRSSHGRSESHALERIHRNVGKQNYGRITKHSIESYGNSIDCLHHMVCRDSANR